MLLAADRAAWKAAEYDFMLQNWHRLRARAPSSALLALEDGLQGPPSA